MKTAGMIYLCDRIGEIIDGKQYESPSMRRGIIDRWKKLYAAMYSTCHLQIAPQSNAVLVGEKGLNSDRQRNFNTRGIDGKYLSGAGKHLKSERSPVPFAYKARVVLKSHQIK